MVVVFSNSCKLEVKNNCLWKYLLDAVHCLRIRIVDKMMTINNVNEETVVIFTENNVNDRLREDITIVIEKSMLVWWEINSYACTCCERRFATFRGLNAHLRFCLTKSQPVLGESWKDSNMTKISYDQTNHLWTTSTDKLVMRMKRWLHRGKTYSSLLKVMWVKAFVKVN